MVGDGIQEVDRAVLGEADHEPPVWAEIAPIFPIRVTRDRLAGGDVPETVRGVRAGDGQQPTVGAERNE